MLITYYSNTIQLFISIYNNILQNKPIKSNLLEPEIIITDNDNIPKWIQTEYTSKYGISSHIKFVNIDDFFLNLACKILHNKSDFIKTIFSKSEIQWILMKILINLSDEKIFLPIIQYLKTDITKNKLFFLSKKISEIWIEYLKYKPNILYDYIQNNKIIHKKNILLNENIPLWYFPILKLLYLQIIKHSKHFTSNNNLNIFNLLRNKIIHFKSIKKYLPNRLFLFNISIISSMHLKILESIGYHIDIHFFCSNPYLKYIKKIQKNITPNTILLTTNITKQKICKKKNISILQQKTNNPLLSSWGQIGLNTITIMSTINNIININAFIKLTEKNNSLLNILQHDILHSKNYISILNSINNKTKKNNNITKFYPKKNRSFYKHRKYLPHDKSLCIHICNDIHQEIEILHCNLITIMSKNNTIQPNDILVLAPNIKHYIPSIQTIFGNAKKKFYIPFNLPIFDIENNSIIISFLNLLNLPKIRCNIKEIFDFLEIPAISEKFSITHQNLIILKNLMINIGIRWGLDSQTFLDFMIPFVKQKHTWKEGIQRILLNQAINDDITINYNLLNNIFSFNTYNSNNNEYIHLIENFIEFINYIQKWKDYLSNKYTIKKWKTCTKEIINDFFIINHSTETPLTLLQHIWIKIINDGIKSKYNELLHINTLIHKIHEQLSYQKSNYFLFNGNVNFGNLTQKYSIPFKIIYLLGMNYSVFPRNNIYTNYNLMIKKPTIEDIDIYNHDKYTFLELFLLAKDHFFISFIEQNYNNNYNISLSSASSVVYELLEYIKNSIYIVIKNNNKKEKIINSEKIYDFICKKHSPTLLNKKNIYFYKKKYQNIPQNIFLLKKKIKNLSINYNSKKNDNTNLNFIFLSELNEFYKHPIKIWAQKKLGLFIKTYSYNNININSEPFYVNKLNQFYMNQQLLTFIIKKKNTNDLFHYFQSKSMIPYGQFGKLYWKTQYDNMNLIAQKIYKYYQYNQYKIKIFISYPEIKITGYLLNVQKNGLLRWSPRKLSITDGIQLWIEHLIYCSMGNIGSSVMYGEQNQWKFDHISAHTAKTLLYPYVIGYLKGMNEPIFLLHKSGEIWLKICFDHDKKQLHTKFYFHKKAYQTLLFYWKENNKYFTIEKHDPYINLIIQDINKYYIKKIILSAKEYILPILIHNIL